MNLRRTQGLRAALLIGFLGLSALAARAEVVEEIVAKVNDDIITKSDLEESEQAIMAEIYRRYAGKELDDQVRRAKATLLRRLIDDKVLFHRAQRLYDMDKMGDVILKSFKEQQQIASDKDLEKLLAQDGMTLNDLKRRLAEMYAPEEVLRFEVGDRVSIGDKEVDEYYNAHLDEFRVPAAATLREIVLLADPSELERRRAEAQAIRDRAAAPGADFAALAREVSEAGTKESGGLLSDIKRGDLTASLEQVAFSLPVGEVSAVIENPYGFHVIKVESRSDERLKSLDEVRESVRNRLANERYNVEREKFMKKAWDESTIDISPEYRDRVATIEK